MTIQTEDGAVQVTAGDHVHTINGVQFCIKLRNIQGEYYLLMGTNHGSGWGEWVTLRDDVLPNTGDPRAILAAALPAANFVIAKALTAPAGGDFPHQMDALIQTVRVTGSTLSL